MRKTKNLIIGFGKAGKTLAADFAKHGEEVILVERDATMYGGTCINIGCIPSKKLLVEGQYHLLDEDKDHAYGESMARKSMLVQKLRAANYDKLAKLSGVTILDGEATFLDEHTVRVQSAGGTEEISAERVFINTGATPRHLSIEGADGGRIYDSTGLLSLPTRPERLVIVGGGFISLEFACMYAAFGTQVTILETGDRFLSRSDDDVAETMSGILEQQGVKIVTSAQTQRFLHQQSHVEVHTSQGIYPAEAVLVAIGRTPATDGLALDRAGIATDERGFVITDEQLRAKPHIWAMGDIAGNGMFTYLSLDDYRIVADTLWGTGQRTIHNRGALPTAVFTNPPLAQVGMDERQAKEAGKVYELKKLSVEMIPKAKVLSRTEGMMKALVDKESGLLLGVTLICEEAHELINLFKLAIDHDIPADALRQMIFTHPTITEGFNDLLA